MKKQLQERLSKYSAAAVVITAGIAGANAQVVYTDVNPDFTSDDDNNNGGFTLTGLDVDNDGTFDYILANRDTTDAATIGHVRYTLIAPYGTAGNAVAGETPSAYDYALALNMNDMIDNTLNWIAATNTMAYNVDSANPYAENWNGVTDKYLGLQFNTGGSTYYGWARLDVLADGDVYTLKDYAYESTAGVGISAGVVGLEEGSLDQLVHFVNQDNNTVLVNVNGNLTDGVVTVVSTSGAIISTGNVVNGTFVVDMNGLTAGMYMINVQFAEGSITKKMMVH